MYNIIVSVAGRCLCEAFERQQGVVVKTVLPRYPQLFASSPCVVLVDAAVDSLVRPKCIWFLHNASCRRTSKAPPLPCRLAGGFNIAAAPLGCAAARAGGDAGRFSLVLCKTRALSRCVCWLRHRPLIHPAAAPSHPPTHPREAFLTRRIVAVAQLVLMR